MTTPRGRGGEPLQNTKMAAYSFGWTPGAFRAWARRRGIAPVTYRDNGKRGQKEGLWDLADIREQVVKDQAFTPLVDNALTSKHA